MKDKTFPNRNSDILEQVVEIAYWAGKTQSAQDAAQQIDQLYRKDICDRLVNKIGSGIRHTDNNYHDLGFTHGIQFALKAIKQELSDE